MQGTCFFIKMYDDNSCRSTSCNESLDLNPNAQSLFPVSMLCSACTDYESCNPRPHRRASSTVTLLCQAMSEGGELRTRSESGPSPHVTLRVQVRLFFRSQGPFSRSAINARVATAARRPIPCSHRAQLDSELLIYTWCLTFTGDYPQR